MAGIRWPPEDSELPQTRVPTTADLISDDDRSVAADSWSIKSDYGSTLDDDQRHVDASDALSTGAFRAASDYSSDKEAPDAEVEPSMLGLQSYWDSAYADELANFHEHGHSGEVWFGADVMDTVTSWTKNLCTNTSEGRLQNLDNNNSSKSESNDHDLSTWNVLDLGTGNGLLLQELAKQGFSDLTGTDYSEGAINLARSLAERDGYTNINFKVDDILDTKLEGQFRLVMDKGTFDAIGLHPDGHVKRIMYWDSVSKLVAPGGILVRSSGCAWFVVLTEASKMPLIDEVLTSCNSTKDELVQEVDTFNQRRLATSQDPAGTSKNQEATFQYLSHVRSYPTFMFGGSEGSRVATVAFRRC